MIREIIEKVDISDDYFCLVAQLVEHGTVNAMVARSSRAETAKFSQRTDNRHYLINDCYWSYSD